MSSSFEDHFWPFRLRQGILSVTSTVVEPPFTSVVRVSDVHGAARLDFGLTGDGVTILVKSRRCKPLVSR